MMLALLFLGALRASERIDLPTALDMALRDGIDAREARFSEQAADAALASRRLAWLPDLHAGASATAAAEASGGSASALVYLSSTTPLYAGGRLRGEREAAEAAVRAVRADSEAVRQDLHLALAVGLLAVGETEAQAASARSALAAEEALAERVGALVAAGTRTRADSLQQAASVARARAAAVTAERDTARAGLALQRLLRLDANAHVTFVEPLAPELEGDAAALVEAARQRRPELAGLQAAYERAEADARAAGAGGRPSLDLVVGADANEALLESAGVAASLRIGVPLFDRGASAERQEQARLALASARLARDTAREDVDYDLRGALLDRSAADAALAAAEQREAAATAAATVVQDRYEAGAATLVELMTTRAEAVAARSARLAAAAETARTRFVLARAVGAL